MTDPSPPTISAEDEVDGLLDNCTVALIQYSDHKLDGTAVTVKDYDNRVIDTFRLKAALHKLLLKQRIDEIQQQIEFYTDVSAKLVAQGGVASITVRATKNVITGLNLRLELLQKSLKEMESKDE